MKKGTIPTQNLPFRENQTSGWYGYLVAARETLGKMGQTPDEYQDITYNLEKQTLSDYKKRSLSRDVAPELIDHNYQDTSPSPPKKSKTESVKKDKKDEHSKDSKISRLKKKIQLLKNQVSGLRAGKISKKTRREIVHEELSHKLTPAQIKQMLKPKREIHKTGPRKGKLKINRSQQAIFLILVSLFFND